MEGSSLRSGGSNNNGVSKSIVVLKSFHDVRDGRSLLSNGDVNAVKSLRCLSSGIVEGSLLVNDGIDGDSGLSSLSISNDKLSLTSSNRDLI